MANPSKPKVLVVQRRMTHYRVPFFIELRAELARRDIELEVAYGVGTREELKKNDAGELSWGTKLQTRYLLAGRICWQPFGHRMREAAMTVLTSENKLIHNLPAQYRLGGSRVALWGHGANLQGDVHSLRERFKRLVAGRADWWFAYTEFSVPLIRQSGFPANRITVLDNTVDTTELNHDAQSVTPERVSALRASMALDGRSVGVFVGSLYKEKRVDLLLESALAIRRRLPQFELLVVGAGPDAATVQEFCKINTWARYLGPLRGKAKVEVLALSQVMLNPGLVGLGILDSFICRVPMLTTDCGLHSPEIAYLKNGENGVMTPDTVDAYAAAVVRLFTDADELERLRKGCESSATRYTLGNMARHFADGAEACLKSPVYRGNGRSADD